MTASRGSNISQIESWPMGLIEAFPITFPMTWRIENPVTDFVIRK
jgi:hypothetical protein